jgi:hydroxymethylbilane synthase
MSSQRITLATRKSPLALAQARAFVAELCARHPGLVVEELLVTTSGDRIQDRPLSEVGGKGLFVKEIEEALLDGRADFAVHSLKDVPPELPDGLLIGCFPRREDPRDAFVSGSGQRLAELAPNSRIGTSSLRRKLQLLAVRPDLEVVPIRGNVDTRLRKAESGEVHAVVLALAGLVRLGLSERATEVLSVEAMIPAVAQGALGIEYRADDAVLHGLLAPLSHQETKIAVTAERAVLRVVEGNCQLPVAAHAISGDSTVRLVGLLAEPDGSRVRRAEVLGRWPLEEAEAVALGEELGRRLL